MKERKGISVKKVTILVAIAILALVPLFSFRAGFQPTRADWSGALVDLYGGAVNNGSGNLVGAPYLQFQAPYGGQGLNIPMDLVEPQSWVYLNANVTYNYWPVQHENVAFAVQEPDGTVYNVFSAFADLNGVALVGFGMPWIAQNPESYFGVWRVTASVHVSGVSVNDTMDFRYDYLARIWDVAAAKPQYLRGEPVRVIYDFGSAAEQTYPVLFKVEISDGSGVVVGHQEMWTGFGRATFPDARNWTDMELIWLPISTNEGNATVHVNAFDKEPSAGGVSYTLDYSPIATISVKPSTLNFSVPDRYSTIQEAINNVTPGDTVLVREGVLHENIVVNKTITLAGEGLDRTFIFGDGVGNVATVRADNVTVIGFTFMNSGVDSAGIALENCSNTLLLNNTVEYNSIGVLVDSSTRSFVYGNNFMNNTQNAFVLNSTVIWNCGYLPGGNYWSEYTGVDVKSGLNQDILVPDGIGDTGFAVDAENLDPYPLLNPVYLGLHDLAITIGRSYEPGGTVLPLKNVEGCDLSLSFSVIVSNKEGSPEVANVTVFANDSQIGSASGMVFLECVFNFTWLPVGRVGDRYNLSARVNPVPSENSTADNTYSTGTITISTPGDINVDGVVNMKDIAQVARCFMCTPHSLGWNSNLDLNDDGIINLADIEAAVNHFGETVQYSVPAGTCLQKGYLSGFHSR